MHDRDFQLYRNRREPSRLRDRDQDAQRGDLESQIDALEAQVRQLGERLAGSDRAQEQEPPASTSVGGVTTQLSDRVIAAAEAVAAEIRADAERQAARIRERNAGR